MVFEVDIEKLVEYMDREDISKRELAKRIGINDGHLVKVLSGKKNPGSKVIKGMFKLGYTADEIFTTQKTIKPSKTSTSKNKNIIQYICDYMNTMAIGCEKEYKLEEVRKIKRSILLEKEDRINKKIYIKGNTKEGRQKINERTSEIAKNTFKLNINTNDIRLFKTCTQLEAKDRQLINQLDDEEGLN